MGITVNESYTLDNGLIINSYYVRLDDNCLDIHKNVERNVLRYNNDTPPQLEEYDKAEYILTAKFNIYVSKETYLKDKLMPIGRKTITLSYDEAPTGNIYDLAYTKFKESLTNFQDDV
jgi:hypothetical protein